LGLASVDDARCVAADPSPPRASAAPPSKKAGPASNRPRPAGAAAYSAAPNNAAPASKKKAAPAQPAANGGSFLDAIVTAISGAPVGEKGRAAIAQQEQARQAAVDQNLRNIEAQFRPQFDQLLYSELAFLRRSCKPDAKPFVEIAKAAKADIRVPLREYISTVYGPQVLGNAGVQRDAATADPRMAMQKLLMPLAEAKLGAEKTRLYRQECDKRMEARQHAVVMNLVAALDERLVLTAQQRAKLVESLSPKYDSSWESYCEIYTSNPQYWPSISDQLIVPLLNEKQVSIWQQAMKPNFGRMFHNVQIGADPELQEIAHMVEEVKDGP